jgi:hypothetical protein
MTRGWHARKALGYIRGYSSEYSARLRTGPTAVGARTMMDSTDATLRSLDAESDGAAYLVGRY